MPLGQILADTLSQWKQNAQTGMQNAWDRTYPARVQVGALMSGDPQTAAKVLKDQIAALTPEGVNNAIINFGVGMVGNIKGINPVNKFSGLYDAMVKSGNEELAIKKQSPNLWTPDNQELGVDDAINDIVYPKNTGKKYPDPLPEYQDKYGDLGGEKYDALEGKISSELRDKWIEENHPNFTDVTDLYNASPNEQGSAFEAGLNHLGVKYTPNYSASSKSNYFYVENPITKQTDKIRFATHAKQAFDADEATLNVNPEGGISSHTWDDAQSYLENLLEHNGQPLDKQIAAQQLQKAVAQ